MYKVFVNEKKLSIANEPISAEKQLHYDGKSTLEMAIDLLENTSCSNICIYGENVHEIWDTFKGLYRIIEAAGGIVHNKEGKILFIYRLSKWDLPKGKIEKGESLEEAAVREVEEETAINNVVLDRFITSTYHIYTERNGEKILKTTHWFLMHYYGDKAPIPQIEEGIKEVSWKNSEEIKATVFPNTFQNIKLILKEFVQD